MQGDNARYSCQTALPGFNANTQEKLRQAKVLIVGIGGLGCPAAQYLVAIGVGVVGLADYDVISLSNLHRQILFGPGDIGIKKVAVATNALRQQNPDVAIVPHHTVVDAYNVMSIVTGYDIVLDCTDNINTKYLLNDACFLAGKPLVYGAIYQYEGQLAVWNVKDEGGQLSPNYRDVFPVVNATKIPNCADGGVMPTLAGVIGCMQANEAIKYLAGISGLLKGKLLIMDAQTSESRIIKLATQTSTHITALPETFEIPVISPRQLAAAMSDYELIDVRTGEERMTFHIGGRHIPLGDLSNEVIPDSKPVVFYCATGKRSGEAAKLIKRKFPAMHVLSLTGGLDAWIRDVH